MEYFVEEKPETGLKNKSKVCCSTDVFNLNEVQTIKNAIQEHLLFIGLDRGNNIRKINLLSLGNSCSTLIDSKNIIRTAIMSASEGVILVHNHPSNSLEPSKEDIYMSNIVNKLLNTFNIQLLDHIIVTEDNFLSMTKAQKIDKKYESKDFKLLDKALLTEENIRLKNENEELRKQLNLEEDMEM